MGDAQNIVMENAQIIFRNFKGEAGPFNNPGDRNFCVVLTPEQAEILREDGWNVKFPEPKEDGDVRDPYLPVAVKYNHYPPNINVITSAGRQHLGEDTVDMLDWADIASVDLTIRPYNWEAAGNTGVKAYVKSMFVILNEDPLERKYALQEAERNQAQD